MKDPRRILVVRTDRIGDVVLSTPVIYNLRKAYPEAYIAFLCRPYTREILEGNPYLNEIIVYDKYGKEKSFWNSIKFARDLAKKRFDLVLVLHPTNRVHMMTFFAGIPQRVGWDRKMGFLLTKKIEHKKQEGKKHELEYTLDLLRALDIEVRSKETYVPVKPQAALIVDRILKDRGLKSQEKIILIHPGASCPSKRWPEKNFSQLIKILSEKTDCEIGVITSVDQKEFGRKLVDENDILDLRGLFSVAEIIALLKSSTLFISNDSGPVHIAASLKVPVISIFGRKDPGLSPLRWRPLGDKAYFFHQDIDCQKCPAHNCQQGFLCLRAIKPRQVADKALEILKDI